MLAVMAFVHNAAAQPADIILHGGKVVTMDDQVPEGHAIAIRGDRILAVGTEEEIAALAGPRTKTINLAGRMAMPGFIECHGHFLGLGDSKRKLSGKNVRPVGRAETAAGQ